MDGPDAVIFLLQSDVAVRERLRDEQQSMLEAKRSTGCGGSHGIGSPPGAAKSTDNSLSC